MAQSDSQAGQRRALLIGSLPYDDERQAMTEALRHLGPYLDALPDGEIGERNETYPKGSRSAWVQTIMDRCEADTETWTVKRPTSRNPDGFAVDYTSGPRLKGRFSPKETAARLSFGWNDFARSSYPMFKELRAQAGLGDLKFQVGLPTALGMTFGILSPIDALRYAGAFNQRLAYEANDILDFVEPGDIRFQLEVPGELAMAYRLPKQAVAIPTRTVLGLLRQIRPEAPFGIHLCLGDPNNEALIKPTSLEKMVHFTNQLVANWPSSHQLDYVHVPLAEAADPPPTDPEWYGPLAAMNLPPGVRFVAGFVHEKCSPQDLERIRTIIDGLRPEPVDIAASCGLGRRNRSAAQQILEATVPLVAD